KFVQRQEEPFRYRRVARRRRIGDRLERSADRDRQDEDDDHQRGRDDPVLEGLMGIKVLGLQGCGPEFLGGRGRVRWLDRSLGGRGWDVDTLAALVCPAIIDIRAELS